MNIIELFVAQAVKKPKKTAISFNESQLSYQEIAEKVRLQSAYLITQGVKQGSHILVILENSVEFSIMMLSAAELGAVIVPINPSLGIDAVKTAIRTTDSAFLISTKHKIKTLLQASDFPIAQMAMFSIDGDVVEYPSVHSLTQLPTTHYQLAQTAIPVESDYILTMTSGSTSDPKPIVFTQKTKIDRAFLGARDLYQLSENEVILTGSPMHHSLGQRLSLLPLLMGGQSVILSHFTPKKWLEAVQQQHVTFTISVSSQLEHIYQTSQSLPSFDLSSLRCLVSSSALLKESSKHALLTLFSCELHECYGASEVGIVTNLSLQDKRLKSVGKALPYVDIQIIDDNNQTLETGKVGEIICSTLTLFSRYYNNEVATKQSLLKGYFKTGDMGYLDEEGYLYYCDRKKDIVIVGGTNVYPKDIEQVLNTHPKVKESAVVGVEDDYFGDVVLAVVVKQDDSLTELELKKFCLTKLADFQQPRLYHFVTELPKNAMGKIAKPVLRQQFKR